MLQTQEWLMYRMMVLPFRGTVQAGEWADKNLTVRWRAMQSTVLGQE